MRALHTASKDQWQPMGFETPGFALAWSPEDSKYLAFGLPSGPVQVVEVLRDAYVTNYRGHETPVQTLAWAPNGKFIASAAEGINAIHVWDAMKGEMLTLYQGHSAPVESVSWSPDSSFIASGGDDTAVHIWKAQQ
jgi:WD40 repeat protein